MSASDRHAYSDSDGRYALVLPLEATAEEIDVAPSKPGWTFSPPFSDLIAVGPDTAGVDFRGTYAGYTVSGVVHDLDQPGSVGLAGFLVTDGTGTTPAGSRADVTNESGEFTLYTTPGTYNLQFTSPSGATLVRQAVVDYSNVSMLAENFSQAHIFDSVAPVVDESAAAATGPSPVGVWLSVKGNDNRGEQRLRYHWETVPPGGAVAFEPSNGTHTARRLLARVAGPGIYTFRARIVDESGNATYSGNVSVTIDPVLASVRVRPRHRTDPLWSAVDVPARTGLEFSAEARNQFGQPMPEPADGFSWSGSPSTTPPSVDAYGVATAGPQNTVRSVVAASGSVRGSATLKATANATPQDATVMGRHVFYNDSSFDGYTTGATAADDGAIATDKVALRPGQTDAMGQPIPTGYANYTNYAKGLNGVMFDLSTALLQGAPPLTPADLVLRLGGANAPADGDPTKWKVPHTLPQISMRAVDGGTRVTLIWPPNADGSPVIKNQWLRVSVLHTVRTRLAAQDVFYFGNLPGESHISDGQARITANDQGTIRAYLDNPATAKTNVGITNIFDFNRDGNVDELDRQISRDNWNMSIVLLAAPT